MIKKLWSDSVVSKLIAEAIKGLWVAIGLPLIVVLWTLIKSYTSELSFIDAWREIYTSITKFFSYGISLGYVALLLVVIYLVRKVIIASNLYRIRNYKTDVFWNATVKWKWIKDNGVLVVKQDDYELICPKCKHNLIHAIDASNYYLSCTNCRFFSAPYYYEPPSNVINLVPMSSFYFYRAMTSKIDANLRYSGLK